MTATQIVNINTHAYIWNMFIYMYKYIYKHVFSSAGGSNEWPSFGGMIMGPGPGDATDWHCRG